MLFHFFLAVQNLNGFLAFMSGTPEANSVVVPCRSHPLRLLPSSLAPARKRESHASLVLTIASVLNCLEVEMRSAFIDLLGQRLSSA